MMQQFLRGRSSKTEIKTPLEYCWTIFRAFLYKFLKMMTVRVYFNGDLAKKTLLAAGFEPRTL